MPYHHPDPKSGKRLILALDVPKEKALTLIRQLANVVAYFKVGLKQIHAHADKELVEAIHESGGNVFLDGKIYDIPNTGSDAAAEVAAARVEMFNVHASGGIAMMRAALKAAEKTAAKQAVDAGFVEISEFGRPLVIGVTLLTSMDYKALEEIGLAPTITGSNQADIEAEKVRFVERLVVNLAKAAQKAGLDGVVASPRETRMIREACGPDFRIITPGIRNNDAPQDDQKRTLTVGEAIAAGSDFPVIGRPIYDAPDPVAAALRFNEEVARALAA